MSNIKWYNEIHVQCESKTIPLRTCGNFSKRLGIFQPHFIRLLCVPIYARLRIFFNYLQLWWSYAILSVTMTTQFRLCAQNDHHLPKRTLAFSDIFPKQLGIFRPNFTRLLNVHMYARVQILFNYIQLWRSYAILSATTQRAFRSMVDILSIMVVALNMA